MWLIWAGPDPAAQVAELLTQIQDEIQRRYHGPALERITVSEFCVRLPARPAQPRDAIDDLSGQAQPTQPTGLTLPPLPAADFTTFLAQARRLLPSADFGRVADTYHQIADQADTWIENHGYLVEPGEEYPVRLAGAVAGWLRDEVLGPAPNPQVALVALRAVQAALFIEGFLLSWDAQALGPDPACALPATLTPAIAGALATMCRTDAAAATALSLHLNHGPAHFDLIRCADVAPDGSVIRNLGDGERTYGPEYLRQAFHTTWSRQRTTDGAFWEMTGHDVIDIPPAARPLLAAHLAWRIAQNAQGSAPLFTHPREPNLRSPAQVLREAISRSCRRIGIQAKAPWAHAGACKEGGDVGFGHRTFTWMGQRGLTLHALPAAATRTTRIRHAAAATRRP